MHFEHWYLEPCIYMHNIRVRKKPSISSVMCKPNMENSYCMHIHIYISIEKSLRDTQSLNE